MAALHQTVPTTTCAKCRRLFKPGDRVSPVYIIQKVGHNLETRDMGAWMGEDFELIHASCPDPGLEGKLLVV